MLLLNECEIVNKTKKFHKEPLKFFVFLGKKCFIQNRGLELLLNSNELIEIFSLLHIILEYFPG